MSYKQKLFSFSKSRLLFALPELAVNAERKRRAEAFEKRYCTGGHKSVY